ncbi:DUF6163 family protein [Methylopila turkensis]|uniref:Uncharacterized protein n=1 Tax=Methylopila turkensis TaxID=1437816 RepID=A0A9W6JSZ3_9HYPH|nr:DUF6163 family protein [Methylopila turkensis]GLK81259.1 hypothetical protein GCM10008174_30000 [Methylopila turkensis]
MNDSDDLAPISLKETRLRGSAAARPWERRLFAFIRVLAVIQLVKGLAHWTALIGVGGEPFAGASTAWRVGMVFFAVADLVAAVGLWLGAAWGAVIWLLTATAQILFAAFAGGSISGHWVVAAFEGAAIVTYLALSLAAKREER